MTDSAEQGLTVEGGSADLPVVVAAAIEQNVTTIRRHYNAFWEAQGRRKTPPTLQPDGLPPIMNIGYWASGATTGREAQIEFVRQLASRVLPLEGKRVLDVGCGVGGPAALLARDYDARVDGFNIVEEHVALGRKLIEAARLDGRVCLRQGNAMKLEVEEGSYDVVFCLEAAHCFVDKASFLAGAWRALRPGGRLIMADIVATTRLPFVRWQPALKLDLITATEWRKLIEAAGLAVEELTAVDAAVYAGWRRWNNYGARARRRRMFEHLCPPNASVLKRQAKRVTAWALERALCRSGLHLGSMLGLRGYVLIAARKPA